MFRLPVPSPRLKFSRICSENLESSNSALDTFPIHSVHFLLPGSNNDRGTYQDILLSDDCTYFMIEDITASCLIQSTFVSNFVRSGVLLGVTVNARVETENFLSITSSGKLVLSLERSIAQSLALQKENPQKKKKRKRLNPFQTIIIDLTSQELSPGKKLFRFISKELSKIDYLKFNLLLKWTPKGNVCVQSIKSYFITQGFKCTAYKPSYKSSSKSFIPAPKINFANTDPDVLHDLLEWINLQICGLNYSSSEEEYVSKLTVPEHFETVKVLNKHSYEGFFTKADILPAIKELNNLFKNDSSLPFIALCISGFQDAYVQANGFQFFSSEDKIIYLIIFPSSNHWLITLNCR